MRIRRQVIKAHEGQAKEQSRVGEVEGLQGVGGGKFSITSMQQIWTAHADKARLQLDLSGETGMKGKRVGRRLLLYYVHAIPFRAC